MTLRYKEAMTQAAAEADEQLVKPLFEFRNYGLQLPHHWSTISNGANFGTDYFTRTAVAKSNIYVNRPEQAQSSTRTSMPMGSGSTARTGTP